VLKRLLGKDMIRVHLMVRGRVGETWLDVDEQIKVAPGTTLAAFIELVGRKGIPLAEAIAKSPHLAHTLMWNGERCPVEESAGRALADGDQIYLLSPLAGG
jgi:molybdopterin converting factor small subunit